MIIQGTQLLVADNSGAKIASCIKVLSGFRRRYAHIGDVIVLSIKRLRTKRRSNSKVKKGAVVKGIVLRTKKGLVSLDGFKTTFPENSVVLLSRQGKPLGTRIFLGVPKPLRYSKYMRLVSMSMGLIK